MKDDELAPPVAAAAADAQWQHWITRHGPATEDIYVAPPKHRCVLTDRGLEQLLDWTVRRGLGACVTRVDVSGQPLTSEGGRVLAHYLGNAAWFPRLEQLDVSHTYLGEAGCVHLARLIRDRGGLCKLTARQADMNDYAHAALLQAMHATGQTVCFASGRDCVTAEASARTRAVVEGNRMLRGECALRHWETTLASSLGYKIPELAWHFRRYLV